MFGRVVKGLTVRAVGSSSGSKSPNVAFNTQCGHPQLLPPHSWVHVDGVGSAGGVLIGLVEKVWIGCVDRVCNRGRH